MATEQKILNLYKKAGETPLACLKHFKNSHKEYCGRTMSYLGRLDPLAEGVLLVAVDDMKTDREKILNFDKEYEFECLWGVETDTFDVLGKITEFATQTPSEKEIVDLVEKLVGKKKQSYPPYSSKTVSGKALFVWAREGKLDSIVIPERDIEIFSTEITEERNINGEELLKEIEKKISQVLGDFRQDEILNIWRENLENNKKKNFLITKMKAHVSSGTYIRALVQEMGSSLKCGATTFSIKRVKVGDFDIKESIQ